MNYLETEAFIKKHYVRYAKKYLKNISHECTINDIPIIIRYPGDILKVVNIDHAIHEHLIVVSLNKKNRLIKASVIAVDDLTHSICDILAEALLRKAARIITVYNHIYGEHSLTEAPEPSEDDIIRLNKTYKMCSRNGILLLDNIILNRFGKYFSESEHMCSMSEYPS
ncbi:MAG: hypothetical protein FIB07_17595 [Candidatus Methanoperedens sp.]|nr:hypothetical protein [Candidatus Methanoperedens sp.]